MSDREGHSGGAGGPDEDLSLPKATVAKMISGKVVSRIIRPFFSFLLRLRRANTLFFCLAELLPNDVTCAKETRDLVIECCVGEHAWQPRRSTVPMSRPLTATFAEFIHLISSEANEICEQESKKTIAPEHIIGALKV